MDGVIEAVSRDEILPLRHAVLRAGRPLETAIYDEDTIPGALHLAYRDPDATIVSCVSFYPMPLDGEPGWQFRGMATRPERRGTGIGGQLLDAGVAEVARRGARLVWCKGRVRAVEFYRRHGFDTRGEQFEVPITGPHYVLVRVLAPADLTAS